MKLNKISSKLIKPHTPTPPNQKKYYISFVDQCVGMMNLAVVLFYQSKSKNDNLLEDSLAKILVQFYPLAGRYMKNDLLIDCSDDGAEFIEAEALDDVMLKDVLAKINTDQLNDLLPGQYFRVGEAAYDPLLSIQATHFPCGGLTIAVSVSHRVFDASSLGTFIAAWSDATNPDSYKTFTPCFDLPSLLPRKDYHNFHLTRSEEYVVSEVDKIVAKRLEFNKLRSESRPNMNGKGSLISSTDPTHFEEFMSKEIDKIVAKRLEFNKEALTRLRSELRPPKVNGKSLSAVRVVCAVIAKALSRVSRSRDFFIFEPVNMREKTASPLPKYACGNFAVASVTRRIAKEIGVEELVVLIDDAVEKSIVDHAEIVSPNRDGRDLIINSLGNLKNEMMNPETNVIVFSDWSKFGFYEADFGGGKPVLTSIGPHRPFPFTNSTVLVSNKEGDRIEAWVNLNVNDMRCFERQDEIKLFLASS